MVKMAEIFKIKVKKGDIEIEVQGDENFVTKKYDEIWNKLSKPVAIEVEAPAKEFIEVTELPETLPTFLEQKGNPDAYNDITMIFAYWLYHKLGIDPFNADDIEECFNITRIKKSTNVYRDLRNNEGRGFIIRLREKKDGKMAYRISMEGEKFVEGLGSNQ